ncbi:MAG: M23 family metallopeptidase [Bacteroidota bacterium]|nr:M23 family metallopeptidase [Bacteroidota bacterium]
MAQKKKLFFYSEDSVSFVEAKGYRLKFMAVVALCTMAVLGIIGTANKYYGDVLGLGFTTAAELTSENTLLKEQVKKLNTRLTEVSSSLQNLAQSDNQLRTAVDLPKIDLDTRTLGTGGVDATVYAGMVSKDASELLTSTSILLGKIEKEVVFQRQSFNDISRKQQENKQLFASLPAIKPMVGTYSYHGYGLRRDPFLGTLRMHEGVDIQNDVGTPVYATGDGMVEFSGSTGSSYGVSVEINHGFGYKTWYAHLSKCAVRSGQHVKRGTLIAYSGNTGRSTGPHLHYEVRRNNIQQNPVEYFVDDVDFEKIKAQLAVK